MSHKLNVKDERWSIISLASYVSDIIAQESGNVLGSDQQSMVISRMKKRLMDIGDITPNEYIKYLKDNYEKEKTELVGLLTTHHTFFFREFTHFDYIRNNLDEIVKKTKLRNEKVIRVLSAACSKGQEVYSLAMFFKEHLKIYPGMDFEIYGTDIDSESIKIAANGVYTYKEVKRIPQLYLSGNWQRGTGTIANFARVKKEIKSKCHFSTSNLLELNKTGKKDYYDIILCRNAFIYFEDESIALICKSFKGMLKDDGLLISGISESLKNIDIKLRSVGPNVYSFKDEVKVVEQEAGTARNNRIEKPKNNIENRIPNPIKVLSVDDSPSILKIMKKIFDEDSDFELVGTAINGLEAEKFLKNNKVDVMTLDIHMPEMNGVEYLKKNYSLLHPKVVVVSSASREDSQYAQETLTHGATDFVEKPSINNLAERAEEIKIKLKMALLNSNIPEKSSLDKTFKNDFVITDCLHKGRFLLGNYSDLPKIASTINCLKGSQPPIFIVFEGNNEFLGITKKELEKKSVKNIEIFNAGVKIKENYIYICDFANDIEGILESYDEESISFSIFGLCTSKVTTQISKVKRSHILLEDLSGHSENVKLLADDIFPWTSFSHVATEYLSKIK